MIRNAPPLTEQAADMDRVWDLFVGIAAGVLVLVVGLVAYVLVRYRRRRDGLPHQVHEHVRLEAAYTLAPLLIVGGLFGVTVVAVTDVEDSSRDPDVTIEVTAFQWQWRFDYPDLGASVLGTESEVPELVLPADSTVRFEMTSTDVIHSFWIPGFRFKRDIFPGETTDFQVDVDSTTGFWENSGVCAEFCGLDHHKMKFSVRIVTPDEFDAWAAEVAG